MSAPRPAFWILLVGLVGVGCTGSIGNSDEIPVVPPAPELPPADPERFFAGQALYDVSCSACHGVFEESEKRGRSTGQIAEALGTIEEMRAFESRLSDEDRALISYALQYEADAVDCPSLDTEYAPAPRTRAILAAELTRRLSLDPLAVNEALSGYILAYDSSVDFDNQVRPQTIVVETTETLLPAMEQVAELWLSASFPVECVEAACAQTILSDLATLLSLPTEAATSALTIFDEAVDLGLAADGVRIALTRLLMSSEFIFDTRPEATNPQSRLVAALARRSPRTDEMSMSIDALLESLLPESRRVLAESFALRWLGIVQKSASLAEVDPALLPVDPALITDLQEESRLHFESWLETNAPLNELMSSDQSFINERIATYYGIEGVVGDEFRQVDMGSRGGGLLSQGAVLISAGGSSSTSPVTRGKWVLDHLLCTNLPPLPSDDVIAEVQSEIDLGADGPRSPREHSSARRAVSQCGGCHSVIDEIGFGLEGFDSWGAERSVYDDGEPVATEGVLPGDNEFEDHHGMADHLRDSMAFRMCATRKISQYLMGRPLTFAETCHVRRLVVDLDESTGAQEWIRRIVGTETFLQEARP